MGTPNYPQDFGTGWAELRRKVTDSFTSGNTRKALTEIKTSVLSLIGDMVIRRTGRLVVEHLGGTNALEVGRHYISDGQTVSGIVMYRPNGSLAFWCWGNQEGDGYWSLWDRAGRIVISDDSRSGWGLARPYIPYNAIPTRLFFNGMETTTATVPTALWTINGRVQHARIHVNAVVQSDAGTTGQIRLRDPGSGAIIAPAQAIPANANTFMSFTGPVPDGWDATAKYDLEAWRTAGTGAIHVLVLYSYGVETA
jgi:hypothetical protein